MGIKCNNNISYVLKAIAIIIFFIGIFISLNLSSEYIDKIDTFRYYGSIPNTFMKIFFINFVPYMSYTFIIYGIASIYDLLLAIYQNNYQVYDDISHDETETQ